MPKELMRPSVVRMVVRGLFRRCAWCGGNGAFFISWFKKIDYCPTCGMSWKRNLQGFELGAATMGVFITFGSILVWMVIGGVSGAPIEVLLGVAAALAILLPIFGYPMTYTVWFGVDLAMHAPESEDLEQAQARLSEHATK